MDEGRTGRDGEGRDAKNVKWKRNKNVRKENKNK